MPQTRFRAMAAEMNADHRYARSSRTRAVSDLPNGAVLIKVHYASLHDKDTLSASGNKYV